MQDEHLDDEELSLLDPLPGSEAPPHDGTADDDEVVVELLADGARYEDVPRLLEELGRPSVSSRTVRRRMSDPDFRRRVSERRGERVHEVAGELSKVARRAVATLEECLAGERDGDRIRAAREVLTLLIRFRGEHELEARLEAVERQLADNQVDRA